MPTPAFTIQREPLDEERSIFVVKNRQGDEVACAQTQHQALTETIPNLMREMREAGEQRRKRAKAISVTTWELFRAIRNEIAPTATFATVFND
jgi:hypothetical protein